MFIVSNTRGIVGQSYLQLPVFRFVIMECRGNDNKIIVRADNHIVFIKSADNLGKYYSTINTQVIIENLYPARSVIIE